MVAVFKRSHIFVICEIILINEICFYTVCNENENFRQEKSFYVTITNMRCTDYMFPSVRTALYNEQYIVFL